MRDAKGISGFVLAGGRSSRLGRDKALLPWPPDETAEGKSRTLLQHSIHRLESVCATVSVCASRDDLPFTGDVIPDALPESGPLGGIVAALEHSMTDWNLMLAVDLPFLPVEVLQALVRSAPQSAAEPRPTSTPLVVCILPRFDGLPQPLCGLYHRSLTPGLRTALEAGNFKMMAALQEACDGPQSMGSGRRIEWWDAAGFAAESPTAPDPGKWFLNINTLRDWQYARQLRCL
ncbi:MAG: molybdenum cofactor guanylyltransferase [Acidobacteriota bacterium]